MISGLPVHAPKACTVLQELCFTGLCPPALHDLCFACHIFKACTDLYDLCSVGTRPQGLPSWRYKPARSQFHWAMPPRPAQPWTIFTPQACAPEACQARDPQTHDLHSAGPCPPSLSSQGSTGRQDLHSTGLSPSSPHSKSLLLHLS
jgi:hypothetical protein